MYGIFSYSAPANRRRRKKVYNTGLTRNLRTFDCAFKNKLTYTYFPPFFRQPLAEQELNVIFIEEYFSR